MKKFKLLTLLIILSFFYINIAAQDVTQVTFLSELDDKPVASYGDALILFKLQSGSTAVVKGKSSSESEYSIAGYTEADTLTKGMASLMTSQYLKLNGSFMYLIFLTERYAFKNCIANGLFTPDGSENDKMSGPELIELLSQISDIRGGK